MEQIPNKMLLENINIDRNISHCQIEAIKYNDFEKANKQLSIF